MLTYWMNHVFLLHSPMPSLFLFDLRQDLTDHHLDYLNYMLDSVIFSSRVNHAHTDTHTHKHAQCCWVTQPLSVHVSRSTHTSVQLRPTHDCWLCEVCFCCSHPTTSITCSEKVKQASFFYLLYYFKCQKQAATLQHLDTIKYLLQCPKKCSCIQKFWTALSIWTILSLTILPLFWLLSVLGYFGNF